MFASLWRFTASEKTGRLNGICNRHCIKPALDIRFNLHKLPLLNFNCSSEKFKTENSCDLLKIKVSLAEDVPARGRGLKPRDV